MFRPRVGVFPVIPARDKDGTDTAIQKGLAAVALLLAILALLTPSASKEVAARTSSKNQQSMAEAVAKHFKESFLSGAPAIAEAPAPTSAPAVAAAAEQCSRGVCDAEQDTDHLPR
jgi:hypothetical protein